MTAPTLTDDELDDALAAIGDFCDLRCPYFAGHARGTAELVDAAAALLQLTPDEARLAAPRRVRARHRPLRRARHGVGQARPARAPPTRSACGCTCTTWSGSSAARAAAPRRAARRRRTTSAWTVPATTAGSAAPCCRRRRGSSPRPTCTTPCSSRVRTARRARPDDAAGELRAEVDAGRLDGDAVDAVLAAAGHARVAPRAAGPAGLTARELDVLALLAQGMSNKAIASTLGISAKTVGNHVEHIYTKLGVNNRAGAALRAMEYGMVGATPTLA